MTNKNCPPLCSMFSAKYKTQEHLHIICIFYLTPSLLNYNQLIVRVPKPILSACFQTRAPFRFWRGIDEMIMMVNKVWLSHVVGQVTSREWCSFQTGVYTSLIQCQRSRCKHTQSGKIGNHFSMTVAVGDTSTIKEHGSKDDRLPLP